MNRAPLGREFQAGTSLTVDQLGVNTPNARLPTSVCVSGTTKLGAENDLSDRVHYIRKLFRVTSRTTMARQL